MPRVFVRIGVNSDRRYEVDVPEDGTVSDLRAAIEGIENVAASRINFIVAGSKIEDNTKQLADLAVDKGVIVIIGREKADGESNEYEVIFEKKPLGIRIQSNHKRINAYVIDYESDEAKGSGAKIGSKIIEVNGNKVDGLATKEIEEMIVKLPVPIKIRFLAKEGMKEEELSQVEGIRPEESKEELPEKWTPKARPGSDANKNPYDYQVEFKTRPFGTVVFSGVGGDSAYIVSFEENSIAPSLGVRAGSKIIAVGTLVVESWKALHIQSEIKNRELPITLTLRGPEGLKAMEYPVSQSDASDAAPAGGPAAPASRDLEKEGSDSFMVYFDKKPLGFGIMSPLGQGAMVSSVQKPELQKKGLLPGTPITMVGGKDVVDMPLAEVADLISQTQLPMMIQFSRDQYFKAGDKVLVQYKDEWYKTTIKSFNPVNRKLSVNYDDKPFRFKNSEVIQDFTRIRKVEDFQRERILSIHT